MIPTSRKFLGCLVSLLLLTASCTGRNPTLLDASGGDGVAMDDGWADDARFAPEGPWDSDLAGPDGRWDHDGPGSPDGPWDHDAGTLPDAPVATNNDTCLKAQPLTLSGGTVTVSGNTSSAFNEYGTAVSCGSIGSVMRGPQLYYSLTMAAGQSYLISLTPQFSAARLYVANSCGATQINAACGSGGLTGDVSGSIASGSTGSLLFTPQSAGTYIIVVDAVLTNADGPFSLTVQQYSLPQHASCTAAKTLTLSGGKATVTESTLGLQNEFGTQITCGDNYTMDGPQLYYKVAMTAGKTYRILWTPSFTYSRVYLFSGGCTPQAINAGCSSGGVSGDYSGLTSANDENSIEFKPTVSGDYTIVVDARVASAAGAFTLTVQDWSPPQNASCAAAQPLTLSGGKVTVQGDTYGAPNEHGQQVTCGTNSDFDGNQVYYTVALKAGQAYKLSLSPSFAARLYLFGSGCTAAAINGDCGSGGLGGDVSGTISSGNTGGFLFTPPADASYTVAVDSPYTSQHGSFSLTIESFSPAPNASCAKAQLLTLSGGKASVQGDTTGAANEFGTQITCGAYSGAFDGPQLYYAVQLTGGTTYLFTLSPSFLARMYIAPDTCLPAQINAACGSGGATGDAETVSGNSTETVAFTPPQSGLYRVAVDSQNPIYYGSFTLQIEQKQVPKSSQCQFAEPLTLAPGGAAIAIGDTTYLPNEFGTAINCGSLSTQDILLGSQQYYQVKLEAQKTYSFTFTPYYNYARFYIFGDTCTYNLINAACGSGGLNGLITAAQSGQSTSVSFTPPQSGIYKLCVDATRNTSSAQGKFQLQISAP